MVLKYSFKFKRGFTIGETVASMISLAVVALSAQSLIMMSSQFRSNQKRTFASMEEQAQYSNLICSHLQNPVAVQVDKSRTYHFNGTEYKVLNPRRNEAKRPTLAFFILEPSRNSGSGSTRLENPSFSSDDFVSNEGLSGSIQDNIKQSIQSVLDDKSIFYIEDQSTAPGPLPPSNTAEYPRPSIFHTHYFPIYADSHTLINYVPEFEQKRYEFGNIKDNSGFIIATRCIENKKFHEKYSLGALIDSTDLKFSAHGYSQDIKNTQALYILTNQRVPFYFPDPTKAGMSQISCAEHDATINHTDSINKYTPVTFIIEFIKKDTMPAIIDYKNETGNSPSFTEAISDPTHREPKNEGMYVDVPFVSDPVKLQARQKNEYQSRILQEAAFSVEFTRITEIPFRNNNPFGIWTSTFIAKSSLPPIALQTHSPFELTFIDVKNTCNPSLYDCKSSPQGKDKLDSLMVGNKKMSDFLKLKDKSCPFRYSNLESSGQAVSFGVSVDIN